MPKLKNKVCKTNNKIKGFSFFKFLKFLVGRIEYNEKEQIMAYKEIATFDEYNHCILETFPRFVLYTNNIRFILINNFIQYSAVLRRK